MANQVCGNPTFLFHRKRQISFAETAITVLPKAPNDMYKEVQVRQYNNYTCARNAARSPLCIVVVVWFFRTGYYPRSEPRRWFWFSSAPIFLKLCSMS